MARFQPALQGRLTQGKAPTPGKGGDPHRTKTQLHGLGLEVVSQWHA
jgi:hypothetical protein